MTTPVNFRVKNGLTVANGVSVTAGNLVITSGSLVIGGTAVNSSFINTAADNAYANGVNYADGKAADAYGNAVAVATESSGNAYSNAVAFAANADNLTTGTLPLARLPATVNIATALNVANTVNIQVSNVTITNGNDTGTFTSSKLDFTDGLTETGNTYYAAISHDKLITEKTYSVANVVYADYGEISRTGMFAVVGIDTTNSSIYVKGVTVNTSVISIGNNTTYSLINSTAIVGNGSLLTSVNATTVGGNSASDLRTYTETYASNADNLSTGTVNSARLPAANSTTAGAVILVNSTSNTSTTAAASAGSVKTAFDAAGSAYTNAVSYTDSAIGAANTAMVANADAAYTNAIAIAANATNLTSGTVNIARIPTVDAVNNTSVSFVASANSVKTAYDAAITANTNAASALANAATAYTNAIAIAANATNLTSGMVNSARLPSGNSTTAGAVVLVDSVSNTSTTAAASAASVKTAYDAAITANTNANTALTAAGAAYTNAVSYTDGAILAANVSGAAATAYANAVSYTDGKIGTANAAITGNAATAYTNAVSYTDGAILAANVSGAAATAYSNAVTYTDTKIGTANTAMVANASAAYTNAIAIAANATNLTSGTVAFARLPTVDSVANTSVALVPTANNVKTAYDAAITANTNAQSALTAAGANSASAYTNAVSYTDTKIGTANTAMAANAAAAYTNAVSYTDTKIGTANTAMAANAAAAYTNATIFAANASNANNGTLAEARLPFRMDQNLRTTDSPTFANGSFTGSVSVGGDLTITGNLISTNIESFSVSDPLIKLGVDNASDVLWGGFTFHYSGSGNTTNHAGLVRDPASKEFIMMSTFGDETAIANNNTINISDPTFSYANLTVNLLKAGNATVFSTINATSFSGNANSASRADAATTANNSTNFGGLSLATVQGQITGNAATAYTNAVSYTDTKIGTANSAITGNAATAYSNAVSYTDTKIGTANTAMVANASAAYTNAIAIAANATNLTSGTVAFARLPSAFIGTTAIQSSSAAQALSGITTLAAGNTTITGFANASIALSVNSTFVANSTAVYATKIVDKDNGSFELNSDGTSYVANLNTSGYLSVQGTADFNNPVTVYSTLTVTSTNQANLGILRVRSTSNFEANVALANNYITRPVLTGYTEHEVANTSTTGSYTLDCAAANFWDLTLTGNITIAPTNVPPSTRMWAGTIVAKQDATGGRTITWPSGTKWPGGVAPPATTTANAIDIWSLMTYDGGTSWIGSLTVKGAA